MGLGRHIRRLRRELGLTQRELSDAAGIDFTYLSKIENERLGYSPSVKTIRALALALSVDELELMRLGGKMPSALGSIAASEEALQFFRKASQVAPRPEDWRDLVEYLDRKMRRRKE